MPRAKVEQAEVIIPKLREVEVKLGRGKTGAEAVKKIGVTKQTNSRSKKKYIGLRMDQAKRLKDHERENALLKRLLANAGSCIDLIARGLRTSVYAVRDALHLHRTSQHPPRRIDKRRQRQPGQPFVPKYQ